MRKSFTFEFVLAYKHRDKLSGIGEGKSHCLFTYVLQREKCNKNRILFILKKTRSPFLETENYLPVSETVMDLCILQLLPRRF